MTSAVRKVLRSFSIFLLIRIQAGLKNGLAGILTCSTLTHFEPAPPPLATPTSVNASALTGKTRYFAFFGLMVKKCHDARPVHAPSRTSPDHENRLAA